MDQTAIGKFISQCRKEKHLTQAQLAERLGVSDRAVSKWETGRSMPDVSIMLDLCEQIDISVNDLLNARRITMENYKEIAEKTLLEMREREEQSARKMLSLEWVIAFIATFAMLGFIMLAAFVDMPNWLRGVIICAGILIFAVGMFFALKIEPASTSVPNARSVMFLITGRSSGHRIPAGQDGFAVLTAARRAGTRRSLPRKSKHKKGSP